MADRKQPTPPPVDQVNPPAPPAPPAKRGDETRDLRDLLEAARFARSVIWHSGMFELSEKMAVEKLDAAIAKAEGRS